VDIPASPDAVVCAWSSLMVDYRSRKKHSMTIALTVAWFSSRRMFEMAAKMYNGKFMSWLQRSRLGNIERRIIAYVDRPQVIYPHVRTGITGQVEIGEGTVLSLRVRIDATGHVKIGERCIIGYGAKIHSHSHMFLTGRVEDITADPRVKTWELTIGDNVFIREEAMIMPQAGSIGSNSIIGVRAVVTKPVGPGEIWAGNPARKIGQRA